MTAKIISTEKLNALRAKRRTNDETDSGKGNADQLPPVSATLIDSLFDAESDQRKVRKGDRKAA